jgi:predicted nucleic acid-binding protein
VIFVDSNILIDVWQDDPRWAAWSLAQLSRSADAGPAGVNAIVVAELSRDFDCVKDIHDRFARLDILSMPMSDAVAFMAGQRFAAYRRRRQGGGSPRVLPDFFIGAHALELGAQLLTRDTAIYAAYFPDLLLITPENHP